MANGEQRGGKEEDGEGRCEEGGRRKEERRMKHARWHCVNERGGMIGTNKQKSTALVDGIRGRRVMMTNMLRARRGHTSAELFDNEYAPRSWRAYERGDIRRHK
jgi:hypothetical protein